MYFVYKGTEWKYIVLRSNHSSYMLLYIHFFLKHCFIHELPLNKFNMKGISIGHVATDMSSKYFSWNPGSIIQNLLKFSVYQGP